MSSVQLHSCPVKSFISCFLFLNVSPVYWEVEERVDGEGELLHVEAEGT